MLIALALVPFVWMAGCGKKPPGTPIAIEQAPRLLTEAFKDAKPETSAAATAIATSVQAGDPASLAHVHELAAQSDLSDEQRAVAYRVAAAVHQKMIENAARGDQKAQAALEHYRATK